VDISFLALFFYWVNFLVIFFFSRLITCEQGREPRFACDSKQVRRKEEEEEEDGFQVNT
jgi:hypothetical protein